MGGVGKGGTAEYLLQLVMHRPYFGTPHHLIPYFSTLFFTVFLNFILWLQMNSHSEQIIVVRMGQGIIDLPCPCFDGALSYGS